MLLLLLPLSFMFYICMRYACMQAVTPALARWPSTCKIDRSSLVSLANPGLFGLWQFRLSLDWLARFGSPTLRLLHCMFLLHVFIIIVIGLCNSDVCARGGLMWVGMVKMFENVQPLESVIGLGGRSSWNFRIRTSSFDGSHALTLLLTHTRTQNCSLSELSLFILYSQI